MRRRFWPLPMRWPLTDEAMRNTGKIILSKAFWKLLVHGLRFRIRLPARSVVSITLEKVRNLPVLRILTEAAIGSYVNKLTHSCTKAARLS